MNIARLEKRDRAKNMARSYRVGDPRPLRFTGRSQGVGPDFRAL
jgi:hypothetical protein